MNRTEPDLEMLIKLIEILETSVGNLLYSDNEKNNIETEIKVKLSKEEFERIEKFMKSKAKFFKNSKQVDTYYQPEIALDYVKKLGYFIEIEVKKYKEEAILEYDKLLKVTKDLGLNLNNIDKRRYPYHIIL